MFRRRLPILTVAAFLAVSPLAPAPAAVAQDCQVGTGLAATLLFPYFEYDPGGGVTTLFAVTNDTNQPTLTRVILWTDWGIPSLAFDVYLNPFDVQSFNVRDLFNGVLPSTGEGEDLSAFNFCDVEDFLPYHPNPALDAGERQQLLADHTGVEGPLLPGECAGEPHGDGVARGYVTVDAVDECSGIRGDDVFTPAWDGYFAEGGGGAGAIAVAQNRLWGDFLIIDPGNAFAQGSEAVGLWADPSRFTDNPTFTFYGRYHAYDGRDERVPVPTLWASRFLDGGPFSGGTDLVIWRDTGSDSVARPVCGDRPGWYPLPQSFVTARDESASDASRISVGEEEDLFPLATQRLAVSSFDLPYAFGRVQLGLADGPGLTAPRQAWVQTVMSANGLYSLGLNARAIGDLCDQAP